MCLHMNVDLCMLYGMYVCGVRRQLTSLRFLLLLHGSQGSNSGYEAWWQTSLFSMNIPQWPIKKKDYKKLSPTLFFYFMCMSVLHVCMSMQHMCSMSAETRRGQLIPLTEVIDRWTVMWKLTIKSWSSLRAAAKALLHWAVSLGHYKNLSFFFLFFLFLVSRDMVSLCNNSPAVLEPVLHIRLTLNFQRAACLDLPPKYWT